MVTVTHETASTEGQGHCGQGTAVTPAKCGKAVSKRKGFARTQTWTSHSPMTQPSSVPRIACPCRRASDPRGMACRRTPAPNSDPFSLHPPSLILPPSLSIDAQRFARGRSARGLIPPSTTRPIPDLPEPRQAYPAFPKRPSNIPIYCPLLPRFAVTIAP